MTEREKLEFNKATSSKETVEPPIKKLKIIEPLKKGQGKTLQSPLSLRYVFESINNQKPKYISHTFNLSEVCDKN